MPSGASAASLKSSSSSSEKSEQTTEKGCPGGHNLASFKTPNGTFSCDVCGKNGLPAGTTMHGCRICNWDMCTACKASKTAVTVQPGTIGIRYQDTQDGSCAVRRILGGQAQALGIKVDWTIVEVNNQPVTTQAEVTQALDSAKNGDSAYAIMFSTTSRDVCCRGLILYFKYCSLFLCWKYHGQYTILGRLLRMLVTIFVPLADFVTDIMVIVVLWTERLIVIATDECPDPCADKECWSYDEFDECLGECPAVCVVLDWRWATWATVFLVWSLRNGFVQWLCMQSCCPGDEYTRLTAGRAVLAWLPGGWWCAVDARAWKDLTCRRRRGGGGGLCGCCFGDWLGLIFLEPAFWLAGAVVMPEVMLYLYIDDAISIWQGREPVRVHLMNCIECWTEAFPQLLLQSLIYLTSCNGEQGYGAQCTPIKEEDKHLCRHRVEDAGDLTEEACTRVDPEDPLTADALCLYESACRPATWLYTFSVIASTLAITKGMVCYFAHSDHIKPEIFTTEKALDRQTDEPADA